LRRESVNRTPPKKEKKGVANTGIRVGLSQEKVVLSGGPAVRTGWLGVPKGKNASKLTKVRGSEKQLKARGGGGPWVLTEPKSRQKEKGGRRGNSRRSSGTREHTTIFAVARKGLRIRFGTGSYQGSVMALKSVGKKGLTRFTFTRVKAGSQKVT